MEYNLTCICGHYKDKHFISKFPFLHCEDCWFKDTELFYPIFHEFKLDNLRYLEDRFLQKEGVR